MSVKRETLFEEVAGLIREHALDKEAILQAETSIDALGVDSIDLMEIIFRLEEAHGVVISPLGLKGRETLGDIVDYAYETITA